jgi:crotonobetaine/carnitine-CoA ligase
MHEGIEKLFGVPVREIYGMTEVGSVLSMPVEDDSMIGSGSCGRPVPFRRCKLMFDGREVPDGSPGELWVAGPGLFSGYYRNSEATEASFEGEWFRTGDLFRRDANGYYYMLGRIKDVIRRSSENIAAAEVELAVTAVDGVLEAAAVPVPDSFRGEEVKVVVARAPNEAGDGLTPRKIIEECKKVLSAFKVPRYVEIYDESLPKTASSKIDKVRLKAEASRITPAIYDATQDKAEGN